MREEAIKKFAKGDIVMANFKCWTCGGDTEYEGDGYWYCPKCNESFYEGEDDEGEPTISYCEMCEHNSEYPSCQSRCPYEDD